MDRLEMLVYWQEAIKTIEQDKIQLGRIVETNSGVNTIQRKIELVDYVPLEIVVSMIDKINEPQKVVVPKFIADWIEYCKRCNLDLQMTLSRLDGDREVGDWAYDENGDLVSEKVDMIARAWLDDYEIEKEKLYTVEIPNNGGTLVLACVNQAIKLVDGNKHFPGKFTKESIENAGFYWALKWAVPVEDN